MNTQQLLQESERARLALLSVLEDQKRIEEILRESEARWRSYVSNAPNVIFTVDKDFKITFINYTLPGYSLSDVMGVSMFNYLPEESREIARKTLDRVFETGEPQSYEAIGYGIHGEPAWYSTNVGPIKKDSNVFSLLLVITDITERKRAEEALIKSEVLYHDLVETSQDLIWQCDSEGRYIYLNPAWEEVFGYKVEEMLGRRFSDFQTPEYAKRDFNEFARLLKCNAVKGLETVHIGKAGNEIHLVFNAKFLTDKNGNITGTRGTAYDITERKHVEEALQETEQRLRLIIDHAPFGAHNYKLDSDGQLIFTGANKAADIILQIDNQQFIGKTIEEAFPPLIRTEIPDAYKRVAETGKSFNIDQIEYKGNIILGAFEVHAVQTAPNQMVAFFRDITERKRAEENIHRRAEELATLLKISQELALTLDLRTILQMTTDRVTELTELKSSAIYLLDGETLRLYATTPPLPPEFPDELRNAPLADHPHIRNAITTGMPVFLPDTATADLTPAERAVSEIRGLSSILYLPLITGTKVLGTLIVTTIEEPRVLCEADINLCSTLANLAALAIENARLYEELKESNSELNTLNKTIRTSTSTLDLSTILDKVMDNALNVVGLEGGTICLINLDDTFKLAVEREASQETIEDFTNNKIKIGDCLCGNCAKECKPLILQTKEAVLEYATREVLRREDIRFHAAFPFVAGGKCAGVLCVFTRTDMKPSERSLKLLEVITSQISLSIENARLYEEIKKYNLQLEHIVSDRTAELQATNKELEAFSYSVSHDLRAPLRAIDGFSRILSEDYEKILDDEGKRLLNVVRTSTGKMDHLITDLLNLSRVGRAGMQQITIDMTTLARSVYAEIAPADIKQKFTLSVKSLPEAYGDSDLIRQVWVNLISNAIKFTLPKSRRKIEIGHRVEDAMNIYYVKDNGVGFNPEYSHKLFNVFQRLHGLEEFEGTGVGLAIVQRIIHRHGGKVWAEGEVDKGATFYFSLPSGFESKK